MTLDDAKKKLEHYCAYQERCHVEVNAKLFSLELNKEQRDEIIVHLINQNFLNEERFARSFCRGKHRIKKWGKRRIINELKARHISKFNIEIALKEISNEAYYDTFDQISLQLWESLMESKILTKRKKFCDYLLRKGWESDMIYEKVKVLEANF